MKNISSIFLCFVFLISCDKGKENGNVDKNFERKINSIEIEDQKKLDSPSSLTYLKKNINKFTNSKRNRDFLSKISFKFYEIKDYNTFNKVSTLLLNFSTSSNDSLNLGIAYRCKAIYYKDNNVLDSSFLFYQKAEKIYSSRKEESLTLANVLLNKGVVQFSAGDFLGSELSLTRAQNIFKDSENKERFYGTLNQLGLVYNELKEYDKAIFFHTKALETVKKYNLQNNQHQEAVCYNNLGYLYIKQRKYNEAIYNFELGLKDKKIKVDDPDLYSLLIDNLAYSRLQLSNFNNLPDLFYEALGIRENLNDKAPITLSNIHLSEYYQKINQLDSAKKYSFRALKIAKESKVPINIISALKQASIVDKKNSTKYSDEYYRITDSLQVVERNSKDRFARISLETDEIIKEKDKLEEQNRTLLYVSLVVGIILTLLFILRAQRARTRELIYKQAQQKANEEIFNLMISQQNVIDESRKEEKQRIARDLHDGVLGRMFGVRLNLDSLNYRNDAESTEKRHQYINELKDIEQDIREISHDLNREKQALINNFISIINKLLEEQSHSFSTNLKYYIDDKIIWDKINNTSKINLYRILQESLQNINKYAEAKHIFVELKKENDNIVLNIEDDGLGFDVTKKSKGIGVQNMISRTDECHGIIDITSKKGHGTKISIKIPIEINTTNII